MRSKFGFRKSIALFCIFALCSAIVMETSILDVEAHPEEVESYGWYIVTVCHYGFIVDVQMVYGYSVVIEPHDPNGSHQMQITYYNTYYFNYVSDCTQTSGEV